MEELQNSQEQNQPSGEQNVALGSDVEMIEVNTPNFFGRHFLHLLAVFGVGFLMFLFVFEIYFTPIYILGRSMQNTINASAISENDQTHKDLVYYRAKDSYDVGDIVIVKSDNYLPKELKTGNSIIKRAIAKSGQNVKFEIYRVTPPVLEVLTDETMEIYYNLWIDDTKLVENYIKDQVCHLTMKVSRAIGYPYADSEDYDLLQEIYATIKAQVAFAFDLVTEASPVWFSVDVGDSEYFVCGDNRNNSTDSRYFGPVNYADILGNVRIHVPYGTNLFVALWKAIFGIK